MDFISGQFAETAAINRGGGVFARGEAIAGAGMPPRPGASQFRPPVTRIRAETMGPVALGVRLELNLPSGAERGVVAQEMRLSWHPKGNAIVCRPVRLAPWTLALHSRPSTANTRCRMNEDREPATKAKASDVKSLTRALDLLDAVAEGPMLLTELAGRVGLSKSQCYKLATALTERGLLVNAPRRGYSLGPRIDELAAIKAGRS